MACTATASSPSSRQTLCPFPVRVSCHTPSSACCNFLSSNVFCVLSSDCDCGTCTRSVQVSSSPSIRAVSARVNSYPLAISVLSPDSSVCHTSVNPSLPCPPSPWRGCTSFRKASSTQESNDLAVCPV